MTLTLFVTPGSPRIRLGDEVSQSRKVDDALEDEGSEKILKKNWHVNLPLTS